MKKLLLLTAIISYAFIANAQSTTTQSSGNDLTFHAFKVDVDFGYASPSSGSGTKAGATFTLEPHYRLSDDFAVGLRIEGAALGSKDATEGDTKIHVSVLTSYCATGDYYLSTDGFMPFVGAGAGFFVRTVDISGETGSSAVSASGTKFGFFPRVGFDASHFRFSAAYDILGDNSSYINFTLGFYLGGGKK